jgi:hypothetical protein
MFEQIGSGFHDSEFYSGKAKRGLVTASVGIFPSTPGDKLKKTVTASFHILSHLYSINHKIIQLCKIWATDVIK